MDEGRKVGKDEGGEGKWGKRRKERKKEGWGKSGIGKKG